MVKRERLGLDAEAPQDGPIRGFVHVVAPMPATAFIVVSPAF